MSATITPSIPPREKYRPGKVRVQGRERGSQGEPGGVTELKRCNLDSEAECMSQMLRRKPMQRCEERPYHAPPRVERLPATWDVRQSHWKGIALAVGPAEPQTKALPN